MKLITIIGLLFCLSGYAQPVTRTEFNALMARVKVLEGKRIIVQGVVGLSAPVVITGTGGVDTLKIPLSTAVVTVDLRPLNARCDSLARAQAGLNSATFTATQNAGKRVDTLGRRVDTTIIKINGIVIFDPNASPVIKSLQDVSAALKAWMDKVKQITFQ